MYVSVYIIYICYVIYNVVCMWYVVYNAHYSCLPQREINFLNFFVVLSLYFYFFIIHQNNEFSKCVYDKFLNSHSEHCL